MAYQTQYVYVTDPQGNQQVTQNRTASLGGFSRSSSTTTGPQGTIERKTQGYQNAPTGKGVPGFLGNRALIFGTWAVSMALVTWDEWTSHGILPRPLRLWDTTWVYAGLALLSTADALVPIANALAIGYTLVLLYQFFQGTGSFGAEGTAIVQGASEVGA